MAYFCGATISLQYEMSAQHPSIKCLAGAQGRVPGLCENYRVCKLFRHRCIQRFFFFFPPLFWLSESGKGVSECILKTGIRLFRCRALAFLCKWQMKMKCALTVVPYLSIIFLQSFQGAKSHARLGPVCSFSSVCSQEDVWLRKCGLQIISDLSEEWITPMPYAKPTLLLPKLQMSLKQMTVLPSSENINYSVPDGRKPMS